MLIGKDTQMRAVDIAIIKDKQEIVKMLILASKLEGVRSGRTITQLG